MLAELVLLGFERHVFLAIHLDAHLRVPVKNFVAILRQVRAQRVPEIDLFQRELARLELRLDVFDEVEVGPLRLRVLGVTGHRDVTPGRFLIQRRAQFAPVEQPAFETCGGVAPARPRLQLVEQRRHLRPVAQVQFLRHKPARRVRRQIVKWQQIHAGQDAGEGGTCKEKAVFKAGVFVLDMDRRNPVMCSTSKL